MKIRISSEALKNAVNRVSTLVDKKSSFAMLAGVLIKADNGKVSVSAMNTYKGTTYATVFIRDTDVTIIKQGSIVIDMVEMAKLLLVKGMIELSVDNHNNVTAKTHKKKTTVYGVTDDFPDAPVVEKDRRHLIATIPDGESFCKDIKFLATTKSINEAKPVYTGFNFNPKGKYMCTCDGFRLTVKQCDWWADDCDWVEFTLEGRLDTDLSKLIQKNQGVINLYAGAMHVAFVGKDFEYYVLVLEAEFLDWKKAMPVNKPTSEFTFTNTKEVLDIMKEYDKYRNKQPLGCVMVDDNGSDDSVVTYFKSNKYETIDRIDIKGKIGETCIAFQPKYMHTVLNFYKEDYTIKMHKATEPIIITKGDWLSLIVPMRVEGTNREKILQELD